MSLCSDKLYSCWIQRAPCLVSGSTGLEEFGDAGSEAVT